MDTVKLEKEIKKIIWWFESVLSKIQTWKASTGVIEDLEVYVPSWGQTQKIQSLANVSLLDWQTIKIESRDKSILSHVEKSIYDANLWFTPINQWDWIMIKIPPMTEERRKEIVKLVKKELENAKIRMRQIRHNSIKDIKNMFEEKEITEDEKKNYEKQLEETIWEYNKKLEQMANMKEQEIMKV